MDNKFKEIRTRMGFSQDDFCKKIDVPKTTYLRYESGKREAPAEVIAKVARLGNVSIEYVMYGKEELKDDENIETISSQNMISLNFYDDIYASAGYGATNDDYQPTKMEFDRNFLEKVLGIKKFDRLDIIRVIGDSMLPSIRDGEYIIIENGADAKNGDTVIANIEGELYVKRLHKFPFEKWLRLESENEDYPHIDLNTPQKLNACNIIGVVRCKIKLY